MTIPPETISTGGGLEPATVDSQAPLDEATLRRLYYYMVKCRTVEERIRLLFRQGRFSGNYFAAVGQEATNVGTTVDLLPEDTIAPVAPQLRHPYHEGDGSEPHVRSHFSAKRQS